MDFIYRPNLSQLTLNNNCLIDNVNNTQNVLNIQYTTPLNSSPILGTDTYTNTLNLTNANLTNTLIFSYINISVDAFYKFKINSGSANYTGACKVYINNFQTVILDSGFETKYNVIKAGIYIICIDVPKTNSTTTVISFNIQYDVQPIGTTHPDRITTNPIWSTCNNLLLNNISCSNLNSNNLINLFINSANEYCKISNNINTNKCINFYNGVESLIANNYNTQINNSIYPSPINGEYSNWSINNTDWNLDLKNLKNLKDQFGSCGVNATRSKNRIYYEPKYGGNANTETPHIIDIQTANINCFTDEYVLIEWNKLGCNVSTIPSAIRTAQLQPTLSILTNELNKYSKTELIKSLAINLNTFLSNSYTDWISGIVSSFELKSGDESGVANNNIIYPNVCYSSGYTWTNGKFSLTIENNGDLILYGTNSSKKTQLWNSGTSGNTSAKLTMGRDGILNIYKSDKTSLWSRKYAAGSYIELLSSGQIVVKNSNGSIIDCLNKIILSNVSDYVSHSPNSIIELSSGLEKLLNNNTTIYPLIRYKNGFTWTNNSRTLSIQSDGNVVSSNNGNPTLSSGTSGSGNYLVLQSDGNLVLYNSKNNALQSSGTSGMSVSYCQLSTQGYIGLMDSNNNLLRVSDPVKNIDLSSTRNAIKENLTTWFKDPNNDQSKDNIKNYFKDTHWENSPFLLIMDYRGHIWEVAHWAFGGFGEPATDTIKRTSAWTDTGKMDYFKGWTYSSKNSFWTGNGLSYRKSPNNIDGYSIDRDQSFPDRDANSNNYYTENDRETFKRDSGFYSNYPKRQYYVSEINPNKTGIPPNSLPGYVRWSEDNSWFVKMDRGDSYNDVAFILFKKHMNKDSYANDMYDNHENIRNRVRNEKISVPYSSLIDNRYHNDEINNPLKSLMKTTGFDNIWSDSYKKLILNSGISSFSNNVSNFSNNRVSRFNKQIDYFENSICDFQNIFTDPNCSDIKYDIYKNYMNTMDTYCKKDSLNSLCTNYINQEIISTDTNKIVPHPNTTNKIKLLAIQESKCSNNENYINDRCISINRIKPEIILKQIKELDKESDIYKKLQISYGNEIEYQNCLIDDNIINDNYINKCNDLQKINKYVDKLQSTKKEVCRKDKNLLNKECIILNKNDLSEIKKECKNNKTSNCKNLCYEYKDNFKDICFWENNQFYIVLMFIFVIMMGGTYMYFKKKVTNITQPIEPQYAQSTAPLMVNKL